MVAGTQASMGKESEGQTMKKQNSLTVAAALFAGQSYCRADRNPVSVGAKVVLLKGYLAGNESDIGDCYIDGEYRVIQDLGTRLILATPDGRAIVREKKLCEVIG